MIELKIWKPKNDTLETKNDKTEVIKMNFKEAVMAMKKGQRVRREDSNKIHCLDNSKRIYYKVDADEYYFVSYGDVEATDWEIYEEEKKTLSDRLITRSEAEVTSQIGMYAHEDKIKQALKEFINYIKDFMPTDYGENQDIDNKAKEIFGERLVS